jgi:glucosamine--fructose-6-phosphate aminotransferase (isomerizing)
MKQTKKDNLEQGTDFPTHLASDVIMEGLLLLQNRGYDSAGMATIDPTPTKSDSHIKITKLATDLKKGVNCVNS